MLEESGRAGGSHQCPLVLLYVLQLKAGCVRWLPLVLL